VVRDLSAAIGADDGNAIVETRQVFRAPGDA